MNALIRDFRYALRSWTRSRGAALAGTASLGLGVMTVTIVLAVSDALLLRPVPGVTTELFRIQGGGGNDPVAVLSYPEFEAIAADHLFASVAVERVNSLVISIKGTPHAVGAATVSSDYFRTLGLSTIRGRTFGPSDLGTPVAVISHAHWRSAWGADSSVVGQSLRAGGVNFTIVGVAAPGFQGGFPGFRTSVWLPIEFLAEVFPRDGDPSRMEDRFLHAFGAQPLVGLPTLDARLQALAQGLSEGPSLRSDRHFRAQRARGVHPSLRSVLVVVLAGLLGISGLVLLIACANTAGLLSARALRRRRETATRQALGASRAQLVRLSLAEATVLGGAGTAVGALLSAWCAAAITRADLGLGVPVGLSLTFDLRLLAYASLTGLVSCFVVGLAPGVAASRPNLVTDLRGSNESLRGHRLRASLMVLQLAVTSLLLVGAGLMLRSAAGAADIDPGFERSTVVTVESELGGRDEHDFWSRAKVLVDAMPNVEASALGLFVHLGDRADQRRIGGVPRTDVPWPLGGVNYTVIDPELLDLLEIRILHGRSFRSELGSGDPLEVVVNAELARRIWPDSDAVGQAMRVEAPNGDVSQGVVVGVSETVKVRRLNEAPTPFFYVATTQWPRDGMVLHVRGSRVDDDFLDGVRARVSSLDPEVAVSVRRMAEHNTVADAIGRTLTRALAGSAAIGLLIATVGVLGSVSHAVQVRRREIAVRMAIGATASRVERTVVTETLRLVLVGLAAGLSLAVLLSPALRPFLYGVTPRNAAVIATAAATLLVAAGWAAWWPTRAVTRRVDLREALGS